MPKPEPLKKADCLVIIPAYNEENTIARLVVEVRSFGFFVLVADDGSKDSTVAKAKASGADVLTAAVNQGKGSALRRGFDHFLKQNFLAALIMDSDGQHDPKELDLFFNALNAGNVQVVVGDRLHDPKGMPWIRRATNRFMSGIISSIAKQDVPDTQCGYRAIRGEALKKLVLRTSHFEIESEILLEAARYGFKIGSIPIQCVYRDEKSRINPFRDTIRFFSFLFKYLKQPK